MRHWTFKESWLASIPSVFRKWRDFSSCIWLWFFLFIVVFVFFLYVLFSFPSSGFSKKWNLMVLDYEEISVGSWWVYSAMDRSPWEVTLLHTIGSLCRGVFSFSTFIVSQFDWVLLMYRSCISILISKNIQFFFSSLVLFIFINERK